MIVRLRGAFVPADARSDETREAEEKDEAM
jgi:hypothetical protein